MIQMDSGLISQFREAVIFQQLFPINGIPITIADVVDEESVFRDERHKRWIYEQTQDRAQAAKIDMPNYVPRTDRHRRMSSK